jgi:NAD(P)H-flavin reductase
MNQANIRAILESYEDATPYVRRLFLRIEEPLPFRFQPGQYVSVRIPGSEGPVYRPYSIASGPNPEGSFELCFRHVDGGIASQYLYSCNAGARLEMNGPTGTFALSGTGAPNAFFVATGTGISPIRSMLQFLFQRPFKGTVQLLFGVRHANEILYRREFEQLQEQHPGFRFLPTLSRPDPGWLGLVGHVQDHLRTLIQADGNYDAYICGHPAMVREVHAIMSQRGLSEEHILHEKYVSS